MTSESGFPESAFWDFSIAIYDKSGVQPACLGLQDRHGLDVNLLLYCCWHAASGRGVLTEDDLAAAAALCAPWHDRIITGLRAVRQALKGGFPPAPGALAAALRDRVIAIEIDCERVEQIMLSAALTDAPATSGSEDRRPAEAVANVRCYLRYRGVTVGDVDREDLMVILAACFADADRAGLATALAIDES